jgi:hypothetical protein
LLLAAVAPLHAQFTVNGCPNSSQVTIDGFTAGTPTASQICLSGSFDTSTLYNVTLIDSNTSQQVTVQGTASGSLLIVSVPPSFYATVSTPGQADPVTININAPQFGPASNQTGSFQINPPLLAGGPVFVSAVNSPVTWTLYTGGTAPYQNGSLIGTVPTGMATFPGSSATWAGTPNQSGVFQFSLTPTDAWGNQITDDLAAYLTPKPLIANLSPLSAPVGSTAQVILNGSGFVAPISIGSTPEPGSSVFFVRGTISTTLTPTNFSATQLTVSVPATLFPTTGSYAFVVVNPGPNGSNGVLFTVTPSITALSTYTRTVGAPPFQLTVTGTGFVNGSVVQTQSQVNLPTTYVSPTVLTATFPTESTTGGMELYVTNPDGTISPDTAPQLTIVAAPVISALSPSSVNAGSPGFALTVTGSQFQTGMTVYFNNNPVPTTLVANQRNNMLMGNVPASAITSAGTVPVSVGTVDGYYTSNLAFTIVSPIPPLQFGISPVPSGVVNTPYTYTFTASGGSGGGYAFSVTSGTLPAGLQLSSGGVVSGTPTVVGSFAFTVQLTDSAGNTTSNLFTIRIAPQPLMLTTGPLANTQINTSLNIQFAGSGGVPPYTFVEFGTLPPGTSIGSTGLLSGTPTKAGAYPFLLFLDDTTGASVSKNYTLNVAFPGLLITPPSPLPSGQINQPYTTQLAATGGVGAPYVWYATGLPSGLTIANNTGLIAGIPRASGSFTVGVTVGDSSGATITQNYTLVIASVTLTVTTTSLANGAVGSSYSALLSASGGSGTYTFTATGLPPGLTLAPTGTLSGTPTAAGSYTVAVTATDSTGLTATASFKVTVTAKLVVTATTISNAVVGVAISPVQLAATGGTPPYQWQSATLPPGLSLAPNGTLSGTPAAAGTFSSTVYAVDNNGALASGSLQVTVGLPVTPAVTISGLPASTAPATQPSVGLSLANPFPATVTATLTLTFAPTSGADDPSIQFATGGRTAQIVIPAGDTVGLTTVGVQTGTVAGTITITAQLTAGTVNVTPTPAPTQTTTVTPGAPVITSVTATRTGTGFTVMVTGYASNRDVDSGTYQFAASEGASLLTSQASTTITPLFTAWYGSASSAPYGSQFTLTQPFTVTGSPSSVLSVTVTLTNALGTSPAATAILQ